MREFNKIFGIGLSKTGTKSLDNAYRILGISTLHYPSPSKFRTRNPEIMSYTAFCDINVTDEWKQLDEEYPNSLFILTTRDLDSWLESCDKAFGGEMEDYMRNRYKDGLSAQIHKRTYGDWGFDTQRFTDVFMKHEEDVYQYFDVTDKDRLLVMNICRGQGWEVLCPFLELPVPTSAFPHSGKRKN